MYLRSAKQKEGVDESGKNDANVAEKTQGKNDSDTVKRQEDGAHATTLKAADLREYGCVKKQLTICVWKAVVNWVGDSTGFVR